MVGHDGPDNRPEKLPAEVPLPELKERGEIMFSGATGAAVGSGRGVATTAPTYGLIKAVIGVIEELPVHASRAQGRGVQPAKNSPTAMLWVPELRAHGPCDDERARHATRRAGAPRKVHSHERARTSCPRPNGAGKAAAAAPAPTRWR